MPELIDTTCHRCWGRGRIGRDLPCGGIVCTRCKGTGEEPDRFNWYTVIVCVVILITGLYAVWSIK